MNRKAAERPLLKPATLGHPVGRENHSPNQPAFRLIHFLFLSACLLLAPGCNRNQYTKEQQELANGGDYWAKYNLWDCYQNGTHGIKKNSAEATRWLKEISQGVWLVKFEPVNGFAPKVPAELMNYMFQYSKLYSSKKELGKAGFFRTKEEQGKLMGSFLSNYPEKLQADIEKMPNLKVVLVQQLSSQDFIKYVATENETL